VKDFLPVFSPHLAKSTGTNLNNTPSKQHNIWPGGKPVCAMMGLMMEEEEEDTSEDPLLPDICVLMILYILAPQCTLYWVSSIKSALYLYQSERELKIIHNCMLT